MGDRQTTITRIIIWVRFLQTLIHSTASPLSPFSSIGSGAFTKRHSDAVGAQSLEHQKALQEQIRKNIALENRIRRLAFEQQRAQKLTDIATQKAGKLLDSRDRHVKQIEEKLF